MDLEKQLMKKIIMVRTRFEEIIPIAFWGSEAMSNGPLA
jgi:hypothetical protein